MSSAIITGDFPSVPKEAISPPCVSNTLQSVLKFWIGFAFFGKLTCLENRPDIVGGVECPGLDGHEEGDPLVVGGVGRVVLALHALQLHDALEVRLVLRRYVRGAWTNSFRYIALDRVKLVTCAAKFPAS